MTSPADVLRRVWLTVDEAHAVSGVSKTELYAALQVGDLVGSQRTSKGRWRVHVDDLNAWMRGGQVAP